MRCRRQRYIIYCVIIALCLLALVDNELSANNDGIISRLFVTRSDVSAVQHVTKSRSASDEGADKEHDEQETRLGVVESHNMSQTIAECGEDCKKLANVLLTWPPDKPKAAIYFLIQNSSLTLLRKSLSALDRFFNNQFGYPVIFFIENDMDTASSRNYIKSLTNSTVFFQVVTFTVPDFITKHVPPAIRGKTRVYDIGYRHMCRFHAKIVYDQPIVRQLEYAWRLDHDSFITRPIRYDVFKFMKDQNFIYGFIKVYLELPAWTVGLWRDTGAYIKANNIQTQFYNKWRQNLMYYNNFEISKMSLWLSEDYQKYIDYIDHRGGIYYHRWGDAPIKSIAVAMFVDKKATHNFKDVGYIHQFFRRP